MRAMNLLEMCRKCMTKSLQTHSCLTKWLASATLKIKNQFVLPGHVDPSKKKTENSKSMVIKESQLTKFRSALDYREMEAKNLFLQELLGVAHNIALTPTSLYHAKEICHHGSIAYSFKCNTF